MSPKDTISPAEYNQRILAADMNPMAKDLMIDQGIGKTGQELYVILNDNALIEEGQRLLHTPTILMQHRYQPTPLTETVLNVA